MNAMDALIKSHPTMTEGSLDRLLEVYTEIIITQDLTDSIRNVALTGILTLSDFCKTNLKKSKYFADSCLPHLLKVLTV